MCSNAITRLPLALMAAALNLSCRRMLPVCLRGVHIFMPTLVKAAIGILAVLLAMSTDIQRVRAQCAPNDKIYIDPRLVPQRPRISREEFINALGDWVTPEEQRRFDEAYYSQNLPIQMPYGNGYVLIHPTNPCIQQYIGR
jgi:hypothetical protein